MGRTQMLLRFASEADFEAEKQRRRERFQRGQVHAPERDILAAAIELLRKHPKVAFAHRVNTGCGYVLDATTYHALVHAGHLKPHQARFMRFGFKGAADVSGMLIGGRRIELEAKTHAGKTTDDQDAFLQVVNAGGGLGRVIRSVDEVMEALA